MWYFLTLILIVFVGILLILIVLVQNPKGGGLASGFTGANQFGGVAQTNKFLEKATWTLALVILGLSLVATIAIPRQKEGQMKADMSEIIKNTDFNSNPVTPIIDETTEEK
jgi:preprotein translocase subunit SecG